MSFFGIDKLFYGLRIVRQHGGFWQSIKKVYRMDTLKDGKKVGEDKYGNKYFTNKRYFWTRERWLEYDPIHGVDYDATMIPAEWYGWMHHKTDYLPDEDPLRPCYKWVMDMEPNPSGSPRQYMCYSTTRPKIEAWIPPKPKKR